MSRDFARVFKSQKYGQLVLMMDLYDDRPQLYILFRVPGQTSVSKISVSGFKDTGVAKDLIYAAIEEATLESMERCFELLLPAELREAMYGE